MAKKHVTGKIVLYKQKEHPENLNYVAVVPQTTPEEVIKALKNSGGRDFAIIDADLTYFYEL